MNLVDLHTHTTESDGTLSPEELVRAAAEAGNVTGQRAPSPGFTNTMLIQLGYAFIF